MITGPDGFTRKFSEKYGYDEDVLTEYFTTLSNIHGIETDEFDDKLIYSFWYGNERLPLLIFENGECFLTPPECKESYQLMEDVGEMEIPQSTVDFDGIILAIYRFLHAIKNSHLY